MKRECQVGDFRIYGGAFPFAGFGVGISGHFEI
jgi:hypothetical protein